MAASSNSDIPQALWERAVELVQKQGMPVNASTIQSAMNTLAEGGSGAATPNMDANIDSLMQKTDNSVTSAPLVTPLPTQKPSRGLDSSAMDAMKREQQSDPDHIGYQGPAKLNSHDAEAPDARGKPITAADAANEAPGTQDYTAIGDGGLGSPGLMEAGSMAALLATLTKRKNAPSLGQSIALGGYEAKPAINQYEGMTKPATDGEMKKAGEGSKRTTRTGRGGGGAARVKVGRKNPYEPDMTLM